MENTEIVLFNNKTDAFEIVADRQIKTIRVAKKSYGILRSGEELFVFDVACPHSGYDLTTGKVSPLGFIVCPWHNFQFNLEKGDEIENRCRHLNIRKAYLNESRNLCFTPW